MYVRTPGQSVSAFAGRAGRRAAWLLRALAALLLLPALLSGGSASAQALLRCEVMQTVRVGCCCRAEASAHESTQISRASCCTRVERDSALPSAAFCAETQLAPTSVMALGPVWRGFASLLSLTPAEVITPPPLAPPPPTRAGPSLVVLHRRFLI